MNNEEKNLLKSYYELLKKYCELKNKLEKVREFVRTNAVIGDYVDDLDYSYVVELLNILEDNERGKSR